MKFIKKDSNGVAIIIVLGMLSLLMIMGVAFSVSMRIERRSAGNYSHSVSTKNLIWAGLTRAIDDINERMSGEIYPPNDLWESRDPDSVKDIYVKLGRGEALEYIPESLVDLVQQSESSWINFNVLWGSGANRSTNVPGRYAYLILNCSDFIDANYAGGATNRMGGLVASELELDEVMGSEMPIDLFDARDADVRYETTQELTGLVGSFIGRTFVNSNFVVFSRYPIGEIDDSDVVYTNQLYIGGDFEDVDRNDFMSQIGEMLEESDGVAPSAAREAYLYDAISDYLDDDNIPKDLESPCTESVPMINEVGLNRASLLYNPPNSYRFGALVDIETFYPFVKASSDDFTVEGNVNIDITADGVALPGSGDMPITATSGYLSNVDVVRYRKATNGGISPPIQLPFTADSNVVINITVTIDDLMVKNSSGDIVDHVLNDSFVFNYSASGVNPSSPKPVTLSPKPYKEAVDPRMNWDAKYFKEISSPPLSTTNLNSILYQNYWTSFSLGLRTNNMAMFENNTEMYVADRGELLSAGELGNIVRGETISYLWQTIRLMDQNAATSTAKKDGVFKYFTTVSNGVGRGSINLNSHDDQILRSAFTRMPSKYPESPNRISSGDLAKIINLISNAPDFRNVSDLASLDWESEFPGQSDIEREAILAYSYGLLGTRQNLFAIIISASPVTTAMGEYAKQTREVTALGSKSAIAYVWRDPFPGEDGRHKCFVQFFKWL